MMMMMMMMMMCGPQGGLDIPERMFHSVRWEWESASRDNMGDVRELIPEFYYLPDFLSNSNHIQLGQTTHKHAQESTFAE